jgi:hypothetical protein
MSQELESAGMSDVPDGECGIFLPCRQDELIDFVSGLFGESQKITKGFYGRFEADLGKILGFHHLLHQRFQQNHNSNIVKTTVKVVYSDNSIVTCDSIDCFAKYNEIKPVVPLAVHVVWIVFVKFPGKIIPEKQSIELSLLVREGRSMAAFDTSDIMDRKNLDSSSCISFTINHTLRSWGADIEALLSNYINNILENEDKFKGMLRDNSGTIALCCSVSAFIVSASFLIYLFFKLVGEKREAVARLLAESGGVIDAKIDFILSTLVDGFWAKMMFFSVGYFFVAIVLTIIIGICIDHILDQRIPSFILLTSKANELKESELKKMQINKIGSVVTIVVSIAVNVFSAVVYEKYIK